MSLTIEPPKDIQKYKKPRSEAAIKASKNYYEKTKAEHIERAIKWHSEKYQEAKETDKYKETRRRLNKKYYEIRKHKLKQLKEQEEKQTEEETQEPEQN